MDNIKIGEIKAKLDKLDNLQNKNRKIEVYRNKTWKETTFDQIKSGDRYRLFEYTGVAVSDLNGNMEWIAQDDSFQTEDGIWMINNKPREGVKSSIPKKQLTKLKNDISRFNERSDEPLNYKGVIYRSGDIIIWNDGDVPATIEKINSAGFSVHWPDTGETAEYDIEQLSDVKHYAESLIKFDEDGIKPKILLPKTNK